MLIIAASILIANPLTFAPTVASAHGGDTVALSSGLYQPLRVSGLSFRPNIVIDATDAMFVPLGDAAAVLINNVDGITVTGLKIRGDTTVAKGTGVRANNSSNVTVKNSSFVGLKRGIVLDHITVGSIERVTFVEMTSDGIDLMGVSNVKIIDVECSGTVAVAGYHADCIQLWTWKGAGPSSDIEITNLKVSGATQGIFLTNNDNIGLRNVNISNVEINTSMPQGILLQGCDQCSIKNSSVRAAPDSRFPVAVRIYGGSVSRARLSSERLVIDGKISR